MFAKFFVYLYIEGTKLEDRVYLRVITEKNNGRGQFLSGLSGSFI